MTTISDAEVVRVWNLVDPEGVGHIGAKNLLQVAMQLGLETDQQAIGDFVRHVVDLRHKDMPEAQLPRTRITRGEFLLNRGKLVANPQPIKIPLPQRGVEKSPMQGLPPRRVANATYGGTEAKAVTGTTSRPMSATRESGSVRHQSVRKRDVCRA